MTLRQAFEQMVRSPKPLVAVRGQGLEREVWGLPPVGIGQMESLLQRVADDDEHDGWEVKRENEAHA